MAKLLHVSTDGTAGPYIMVPSGQSDALMAYLSENGVSGTLDLGAIQLEGKGVEDVIDLGMGADVAAVQALLDRWWGLPDISASDTATSPEGPTSFEPVGGGEASLKGYRYQSFPSKGHLEAAGTFTPSFVIVWDPEIISEDDYADLVTALGDIVRASGGEGVQRIKSRGFGVPCEAGVPA